MDVRVERECLFVLRRKAWAVFVSRSVFVSRTTGKPRRGVGEDLARRQRRQPLRRRGGDSATGRATRGSSSDALSRGKPRKRRLSYRKYFSPRVYRGLVKIWDNLSQKIWDKPPCKRDLSSFSFCLRTLRRPSNLPFSPHFRPLKFFSLSPLDGCRQNMVSYALFLIKGLQSDMVSGPRVSRAA